jgi:hypothetical protein
MVICHCKIFGGQWECCSVVERLPSMCEVLLAPQKTKTILGFWLVYFLEIKNVFKNDWLSRVLYISRMLQIFYQVCDLQFFSNLWQIFIIFFFFFLVGLGFEPLYSRSSTTWATTPVHFAQVILEMGGPEDLFSWADLELGSPK